MPAPAFTVLSIQETTKQAPNGQLAAMVVVTFKVGNYGPFTESFEKTGFDPNGVNTRLAAFAMQVNLIHGTSTPPQ